MMIHIHHLLLCFITMSLMRPGSASRGLSERARSHSRLSTPSNEVVTPYKYLYSEDIYDRLRHLAATYPRLATLTSAQELYGLPVAGNPEKDCPFEKSNAEDRHGGGCKQWILTIEDGIAHGGINNNNNDNDNEEEDAAAMQYLPEVFLSGALHGNERVGPTTVVETATLLLEAAWCESLPENTSRVSSVNDGLLNNPQEANNHDHLGGAQCRRELTERGISPPLRRWLARLVTTRRIIIVPTANALGYYRNQREENGIDPNRDFPFDLTDYKQCMQTVAARTLNEIFKRHVIQLAFTFHGGMRAIGYEWGAPSYKRDSQSPDDDAQRQIAASYAAFAGPYLGANGENAQSHNHHHHHHNDEGRDGKVPNHYPIGDMNSLVYPVRGGMEDWAYGASWDTDHTSPCTPDPHNYGEYPTSRTTYGPAPLRMFNMLVETSDNKEPSESALGTSEELFDINGRGNGHVSRNIRMSLLMAELVEPYVRILGVREGEDAVTLGSEHEGWGQVRLVDDVVPLFDRRSLELDASGRRRERTLRNQHAGRSRGHKFCHTSKVIGVPQAPRNDDNNNNDNNNSAGTIDVEWTVGGAFSIDETQLVYAKWSDIKDTILDRCMGSPADQPLQSELDAFLKEQESATHSILHFSEVQSGRTKWHEDGPSPLRQSNSHENEDEDAILQHPVFTSSLHLASYEPGDVLAVFARATVDSSWNPSTFSPKIPMPQSHLAQVRTNSTWAMEGEESDPITPHAAYDEDRATRVSGGEYQEESQKPHRPRSKVQGRTVWFSVPLTVVVGPSANPVRDLSSRPSAASASGSGSAAQEAGQTPVFGGFTLGGLTRRNPEGEMAPSWLQYQQPNGDNHDATSSNSGVYQRGGSFGGLYNDPSSTSLGIRVGLGALVALVALTAFKMTLSSSSSSTSNNAIRRGKRRNIAVAGSYDEAETDDYLEEEEEEGGEQRSANGGSLGHASDNEDDDDDVDGLGRGTEMETMALNSSSDSASSSSSSSASASSPDGQSWDEHDARVEK